MKQRLLLALLMLLTSVGVAVGQTAAGYGTLILNIQKGESVTVTATGGLIRIDEETDNISSIKIDGSKETDNFSKTIRVGLNVKTLEVSGKVIHANLDDPQVESLTFTTNGELKTVDVNKATALKALNAGNNKINNISWPNQDVAISGNQTIDASAVKGSANGFNVLNAVHSASVSLVGLGKDVKDSEITISDWKAESGTIVGKPYDTGYYYFVDGSGYYASGKISCKLTKGDASVTLTGIEITPALIEIKVLASDKNMWGDEVGSITSLETNCNNKNEHQVNSSVYTLHQGDIITVSTTPKIGYEISSFDVTSSLVQKGEKNQFEIKAKPGNNTNVQQEVSIKAVFKGIPQKITLSKLPENGGTYNAYELIQKTPGGTVEEAERKLLVVGNENKTYEVAYGNGIELNATPDNFYKAYYKINNDAETEFPAGASYQLKVDGSKSILVSFKPKSMNSAYSFVLSGIETGKWRDVFDGIRVGEISVADDLQNKSVSDPVELTDLPSIVAGQMANMKLAVKDGYVVNSIVLNGGEPWKPQPTDKSNIYNVAFEAPEDGNAAFVINVTKLSILPIYVNGVAVGANNEISKAQEYTYDGTAKKFAYTTGSSGLSLDLQYALIGTNGPTSYDAKEPVNAGSYAVKYSRKADNTYAAMAGEFTLTGSNKAVLVIKPADVQIKKVPEVKAVKQDDGTYKYEIGAGEGSALGNTVKGVFEIVAVNGKNNGIEVTNIADAEVMYKSGDEVPGGTNAEAHTVTLRFKVQNDGKDDVNYQAAAVVVPVKVGDKELETVTITIDPKDVRIDNVSVDNVPVTVKVFNGTQEIKNGNSEFEAEVANDPTQSVKVKLQAIVDGYNEVWFINVTDDTDKHQANYISGNVFETAPFVPTQAKYGIILKGKMKEDVYKIELKEASYSTPYTGKNILYDLDNVTITKEGTEVTGADKNALFSSIYYTDKAGNRLADAPVNAGYYIAHLDIPMDVQNGLSGASFTMPMQITKKVPTITWPTSVDMIGKGQTLEAATLRGGSAEVQGKFSYVDAATTIPEDGENYRIQFVPNDQTNYEIAYLEIEDQTIALDIKVSDKPILAIADVQNGKIVVDNYAKNTQIPAGTKLTIRAIPNEDFEVESITVKGTKTSQTYSGSTVTIEMPDESILVTGSFRVIKEDPEEIIDPNTQYIVTLPEANAVRGAIINNPGKNGVKFNDPFTFSISTLAADVKNLVVKANGATLTPTSAGTYRLSSVTGNTTITVSLPNPTELKVNIPREYKNTKGYLVGKVQVEGPADGKCYYGDQLTLVAYPESGVSFTRWSDSNREQLREITVTKDLELKAEFSGTPTGIEDIESASIYAGNGYIQVKNVVNADLTVVSISGRIQTKQQLSGDTQVRVPAGVYVVILESGQEVKRVKVIVR